MGQSEPIVLSYRVSSVIKEAAEQIQVPYIMMNSGAVHNPAIIAGITDAGMIFVPSVEGISHAPHEFTRREDIARGCELLLQTLLRLSE